MGRSPSFIVCIRKEVFTNTTLNVWAFPTLRKQGVYLSISPGPLCYKVTFRSRCTSRLPPGMCQVALRRSARDPSDKRARRLTEGRICGRTQTTSAIFPCFACLRAHVIYGDTKKRENERTYLDIASRYSRVRINSFSSIKRSI